MSDGFPKILQRIEAKVDAIIEGLALTKEHLKGVEALKPKVAKEEDWTKAAEEGGAPATEAAPAAPPAEAAPDPLATPATPAAEQPPPATPTTRPAEQPATTTTSTSTPQRGRYVEEKEPKDK